MCVAEGKALHKDKVPPESDRTKRILSWTLGQEHLTD